MIVYIVNNPRFGIARDRETSSALQLAGWQVLTIWQCELRDCEALIARLLKFLGSSASQA